MRLRLIFRKVWERLSGIEPRRVWNELTNTQNELTNTQNRIKQICQETVFLVKALQIQKVKESVDVAVVITTKNRPQSLLQALSSINVQTCAPKQIVIVNNGEKFSKNFETEIQNQCSRVINVDIIEGQHFSSISACRNQGLLTASTKYVCYLDDDNIMWPSWIENAFKEISNQQLGFVYGIQLREDVDTFYYHESYDVIRIKDTNLIDTNSIMHIRTLGRWTSGVTRLSDWSFVLNYLTDHPKSQIVPIEYIASIYMIDALERISSPLYSPYKVLIGLLHDLIPNGKEILLNNCRYCVICSTSNSFSQGPNGRLSATCQTCGSLERHRGLRIIQEVISNYLNMNHVLGDIIEVAPSKVSKKIFSEFDDNYRTFDLNPATDGRECDFVADICKMPLEDNSVREFVALHVLEHVESDHLAMQEISRVLHPNGVSVLQVPLAGPPLTTKEDLIENDAERIAAYGQIDHVRLYGEDILNRMKLNGLEGIFFSIKEMLPEFLIQILGLEDGARFILAMPVKINKSERGMSVLSTSLRKDFSNLDIFSDLIKERKRSTRVEES